MPLFVYCDSHCTQMFQFHSLLISSCYMQLHWINYLPSFCYSFHSNQTKTSSLSSVEMTNTVIPMKKKDVSSHVGPGATFSGSFNKSTWMEERALFFLGTQNTEQFTRKHSSITLIKGRRDRSLNINRNIPGKYPVEAKKVKKSFIFSWNTKHTAIHEEALLHYFDQRKKGQKFEYQPEHPREVSSGSKESEAETESKYQVQNKY